MRGMTGMREMRGMRGMREMRRMRGMKLRSRKLRLCVGIKRKKTKEMRTINTHQPIVDHITLSLLSK